MQLLLLDYVAFPLDPQLFGLLANFSLLNDQFFRLDLYHLQIHSCRLCALIVRGLISLLCCDGESTLSLFNGGRVLFFLFFALYAG